MARYETEYKGIPADFAQPRGMDPNYQDGYWGMRMRGGFGRAPYGTFRNQWRYDLETFGGFGGIHGPSRLGRAHPDLESGTYRDEFHEQRLIQDFNANSPAYQGDRRGREPHPEHPHDVVARERPWSPRRSYDRRYGDGGLSSGGYGESWARGPAPGAR